ISCEKYQIKYVSEKRFFRQILTHGETIGTAVIDLKIGTIQLAVIALVIDVQEEFILIGRAVIRAFSLSQDIDLQVYQKDMTRKVKSRVSFKQEELPEQYQQYFTKLRKALTKPRF